ncbi:MAG: FtsX-like permease family protein [Erysipelotrichaceae bacterium]|nr:FtsX-like permease family protein [Erysipelotrichaceae bacterium]
MKKTQFIDAIKNIKKRLPSFLSVTLVVAIGTGGFFTTQNIYRSLTAAFDKVYERQDFKNLDLVSSGGVTQSDLELVNAVPGVNETEAVIRINGELSSNADKYNVQIISLTEKVSVPALMEGRLPSKQNEVAINEDLAAEAGIKVLDKVVIKNTSALSSNPLKEEEFTVSAIVRHPEYLRRAQTWAVVLPLSAFDLGATNDSFTNLYVTGDEGVEEELWKLLPTLCAQTTERIQETAEDLIQEKTEEVNEQLKQAEEEIKAQEEEAQKQLDAAERQINGYESQFTDGKKQIEEGKKQLEEAYQKLLQGEADVKKGEKQLKQLKDAYDKATTLLQRISEVLEREVTTEELSGYLDRIKELISDLKDAVDSGDQSRIEEALDTLFDYISTPDIEKIIEELAGIEDFVNTDALIKDLEEKKQLIQNLLDGIIDGSSDFLDLFTGDGLTRYLETLKERMNDLADALEEESIEKIIQAREAIDELRYNKTTIIISMLLEHYTGLDLEDVFRMIDEAETEEMVHNAQEKATQYIETLINSIEPLGGLTKDKVIVLLTEYLEKIEHLEEAIENLDFPAFISSVKDLLLFVSQEDFKFLKDLIYEYFDLDILVTLGEYISSQKLSSLLTTIDMLQMGLEMYPELPDMIAEAEKKLKNGKKQLSAGWNAYNAGLEELKEKEALLSNAQTGITDARLQLEQKRQEALRALQEAKDKLTQARKDAEEQIARNREEILGRKFNWVIQDRSANASYADNRGAINGARSSNLAFGALFFMVIALVCFSTIAIIVEEEKKSIGTTKAFGFYNREILGKYLVFGLSASVIGSVLGGIIGFVVCRLVLNSFENTNVYIMGRYAVTLSPLSMVIVSILVAAICALATFLACVDLLKSPAALLMKGETISTRDRKNKKKELRTTKPKRSLYSRLILRNIINEKERVMITVFIVAISCFCVGVGITLRDGFVGMIERQKSEIYLYDFRIDYTGDILPEEIKQVELVLNQNDANYLVANYSAHLYEKNRKIDGLYVITADKDKLNDFIAVKDPKTRKPISLPQEGVLVQLRLSESYDVSPGSYLTLYDNQLETYQAYVSGCFQNYQGRLVLSSKEAYRQIFHEDAENNCYFVRLNQNNFKTVQHLLSDISHISIEKADSYKQRFMTATNLFNIIIILMTLMSIVMSFMILTNLANIYITRKKKELIVMRINGFSIKETIRYLAKETILTTLLGDVLALIMGFCFGIVAIRLLEQPDVQFIRTFNLKAWAIAIVLESLFSIIINSTVFRKVKKLNFREVL